MRTSIITLLLFLATSLHANDSIHVAILGDSNTWLGGDQCDQPRGWNTWFREAFRPASCRSYARSGATWTNTVRTKSNPEENTAVLSDDNVAYNQIVRLKEACKSGTQPSPHIILIALGTNDAWFTKHRPGLFDISPQQAFASDSTTIHRHPSTVLSLAESVRYGCEMLADALPDAQIILLTPMQSTSIPYDNIRLTGDIIEECANRMSIPVIRLDKESAVSSLREKHEKRFTTDGTHTSEKGARRNGRFVANKVRSLLHVSPNKTKLRSHQSLQQK